MTAPASWSAARHRRFLPRHPLVRAQMIKQSALLPAFLINTSLQRGVVRSCAQRNRFIGFVGCSSPHLFRALGLAREIFTHECAKFTRCNHGS